MARVIGILMCLVLAGCGAVPAATTQAGLSTEVTLAPGATVSVKGAELMARFVAVTGDSRCPRDVTCIWAGEVRVQLEIQAGQVASQAELLEGGSTIAGDYRVTLVRVEPQPTSTAKIAAQDYRATLKIDKAG